MVGVDRATEKPSGRLTWNEELERETVFSSR